MSEVAQLVEHERKMDHVRDPNSNLSFHAKDVVGGSSPSLTLYGDVVQREHSSSDNETVNNFIGTPTAITMVKANV